MSRFLRILFLGLFLSPQLGQIILPAEAYCAEQDCCTPDGLCHTTCVECASRATNLPVTLQAEPLNSPPRQAPIATTAAPMPPPPTDILHVPKSSS